MNPLFRAFTILSGLWASYGIGNRVIDIFKFRNDDKANYPSSSLKSSEERKKEYQQKSTNILEKENMDVNYIYTKKNIIL